MFPDSNRRQTSLEKLKPKRHSAKALRLLPSILRGNKSIFHMTLSARGVLWLLSTIAVPAGAAHLTCTVFPPRWQTAFSQGCFRGGEPSPGWRFWGGQLAAGVVTVAAAMCIVWHPAAQPGALLFTHPVPVVSGMPTTRPTGYDAQKGGQPSPDPPPPFRPNHQVAGDPQGIHSPSRLSAPAPQPNKSPPGADAKSLCVANSR